MEPVNLQEKFSDDEVEIVSPPKKKAKKDSGPLTRYWVGTINNPTNDQVPRDWPDVQYAVWQKEKGAQGTEHLQVYVVFRQKKRLGWLKSACDPRAHWEGRLGSHQEAKAYCMKEETRVAGPFETGDELRTVVRDDVSMVEAFNVLLGYWPDSPE